jgi:hypothetical protein
MITIMKKILILFLIVAVSGITATAQKAFFPSKAGIKLTYQSYDKKGKTTGQVIYTVKEVSGSGDHFKVTYGIESLDDKGNKLFIDEVSVRQEGDKMYFDMGNFLNKAAFQQNGEIPPTVEISGNNMEIPVVPVPGVGLPDASVSMAMKMGFISLKMAVNITNRKVEAIEDISVKGGSFNAFKLTGDVSGTVLGIKVNSKSVEWYAYGIGTVKSESYDKKGNLETKMELIEIQQ